MKAEKRRKRTKRIQKRRNVLRNRPKMKYGLEVSDGDGGWRPAAVFKNDKEMELHCSKTEKLRKQGQTIIPGRIVDNDGKVIRRIEGGTPRQVTPEVPVSVKSELDGPLRPGFQGLKGQRASDQVK